MRRYIETAWPTLEQLSLTSEDPDDIRFCTSAAEAADGADFIQENVLKDWLSNAPHLLRLSLS